MVLEAPINVRADLARDSDLDVYAAAVHDEEMEPYQVAWEQVLNEEHRVVIVCPPDTFKSTTVQRWCERQIGYNPEIRILWLMDSGSQAERRVMSIAQTITGNPVYRKAFPNVEPDPDAQWTHQALYVKRKRKSPDPTLMGVGWDGPYQGFHFDVIVCDDLTKQKDVKSDTTMEMQRQLVRGVILDRLVKPTGRIVVIMTRWGEEDLLPTFQSMGFTVIQMPVIGDYPWGPTISNTRFPISQMEQLRIDKTDALFDLTYMCNPSAAESGLIKRDHIKYWDKDSLPPSATFTIMAVDPAASTKTYADPSCIGLGLFSPANRAVYVTDMDDKRRDAVQLERDILRYAQRTAGLVAIGLETVAYQLSLYQRLRKEYNLPVIELPYRTRRQVMNKQVGLDRDKASRALYVEWKFTHNQLYLPLRKDGQGAALPMFDGVSIESELAQVPNGSHDDRMDVLASLCAVADSYSVPLLGQFFSVRAGW